MDKKILVRSEIRFILNDLNKGYELFFCLMRL